MALGSMDDFNQKKIALEQQLREAEAQENTEKMGALDWALEKLEASKHLYEEGFKESLEIPPQQLERIENDGGSKEVAQSETDKVNEEVQELKTETEEKIVEKTKSFEQGDVKTTKEGREQKKKDYMIALAIELSKSPEAFPFMGIDPEAYSGMKIQEEPYLDTEYFTPVDDVIKKFQEKGMKIVLGEDQDAYALPLGSTDLQGEGILLKNLKIDKAMDIRLHQLILLKRWNGPDITMSI